MNDTVVEYSWNVALVSDWSKEVIREHVSFFGMEMHVLSYQTPFVERGGMSS